MMPYNINGSPNKRLRPDSEEEWGTPAENVANLNTRNGGASRGQGFEIPGFSAKIKETSERSVSIMGADRQRRERYGTPVGESLGGTGAKIVVIAPEALFKAISTYKPLNRDLERLVHNKTVVKVSLTGSAFDFANDAVKKKHHVEGWGEGSMIVLLIDGHVLSDMQKEFLNSAASILYMAVGKDSARAVLLVEGTCSSVEVGAARKHILLGSGPSNNNISKRPYCFSCGDTASGGAPAARPTTPELVVQRPKAWKK